MSSIVISGDTSGAITLAAPSVAGTNTATLPAATGTVMVSGNMPAFSAYAGSSQSISTAVFTLVQINTKEFDTNTNFNTSTYAFTPTVAGYYQVTANVGWAGGIGSSLGMTSIYKNGSEFKRGSGISGLNGQDCFVPASALIYMNGSTDYIQIYAFQNGGVSHNTYSGSSLTYFQASMVRAA